ncbi:MAG TPA: aldehyde dehydrogenase family protein [Longimicrobiales bacterium]
MSVGAAELGGNGSLAVIAPATGEVLGRVPVLGAAEVRVLVSRARAAQPAWAAAGFRARGRHLDRYRRVMAAHADELAELSCSETGKLRFEALLGDVLPTCDLARWYVRRAAKVLGRRRVPSGWLVTKRCYQVREPYGVIGVISPWNFPVLNTMRAVLAGLAAGNTVVLKPSEYSPLTALRLQELAEEAGLPADVFLVATGDGTTGAALIEAGVDKVSFTGSVESGRRVARLAAERLVPVTLELGGKDALIVLADADVERAAHTAVAGAFLNAGQVCISVERAYVEAPVYDRFLEHVVRAAAALEVGSDGVGGGAVGAITTKAQMERLARQIRDAVERGARVLVGGRRLEGRGRYFLPTVLADVDHSMAVMREETFGPVLPVMKVRDAEEALRLANDSPYALGASIFGARRRAERLAPELRSGMICVNDVMVNGLVPGLPFGGAGTSGYGRVCGDDGLLEMSRPRAFVFDRRLAARSLADYRLLLRAGWPRMLGFIGLLHGAGRVRLRALRRLLRGEP